MLKPSMPVRSLNFSFKKGITLGFWKKSHSKISMKKKSHYPMVKESFTNSEVKGKCQSSLATATSTASAKRVSHCDTLLAEINLSKNATADSA